MKTIIYYFTGTGNSLAAARKIAAVLGDCELVPVATLAGTGDTITPGAERVGIVFPVYFSGMPVMVASFAERLDTHAVQYLFAVVTHGGGGESGALRQLDTILKQRQGRGLDAGFGVPMPGNYILMYESPQGGKQQEILNGADSAIAGIAREVARCGKQAPSSALIPRILNTLIYPWFRSRVHTSDSGFVVSDTCTSCGTCVAVCPAQNIELRDGRPVFLHRCELCCGCIHACPVQAIDSGPKTKGRQRYRNPDVTLADLKIPLGEKPAPES